MFALQVLQHLGGTLILQFIPIPRAGAPPANAINLTLFAVMGVGLLLSLWERGEPGAGS